MATGLRFLSPSDFQALLPDLLLVKSWLPPGLKQFPGPQVLQTTPVPVSEVVVNCHCLSKAAELSTTRVTAWSVS